MPFTLLKSSTLLKGRAAMIFLAVAGPTPGRASKAFWSAVFRSTGAPVPGSAAFGSLALVVGAAETFLPVFFSSLAVAGAAVWIDAGSLRFKNRRSVDFCPLCAPKDHFQGFHYADHIFNILESLRRKAIGKLNDARGLGSRPVL